MANQLPCLAPALPRQKPSGARINWPDADVEKSSGRIWGLRVVPTYHSRLLIDTYGPVRYNFLPYAVPAEP